MNDCLVTTLNTVVDNSELPMLNAIKVTVHPTDDETHRRITVNSTNLSDLEIITDGNHSYSVETISSGKRITFENGEYNAFIKGKYDLTRLQIITGTGNPTDIGFDVKGISYANKLTRLALCGANISGNIEDLVVGSENNENITYFEFYFSNISGNLESIQNWINLEQLYFQKQGAFNSIQVSGNIGTIVGKMTKLSSIWFNGAPNIVGSIESVVENQCSNGRTSGTLTVRTNSIVTLNSTNLADSTNLVLTYSTTGCNISIDSNVVATYNKSTNTWTYA